MKIWLICMGGLITIALVVLVFTLVTSDGADYNSQTIKNGDNYTTTYTNNNTGTTSGDRGHITGNTITNHSRNYDTQNTNNNRITTHTYTNKTTGATTGGSTWKSGNTTQTYGTPAPSYND